MSSEDIVRQIIRKIVSASTEYFRKTKKENEVILENQNIDFKLPIKNDVTPTIDNPLTSIPGGVSRLFASGIHSHLKLPEVTDTLAAFMIRAVVLDPTNRFQIDKEMPQTEICIHKIISMDNPGMNIIRTQVYFDSDFPSQVDFLKKEKNVRIEQCSSLIREIFGLVYFVVMPRCQVEEYVSLNRKIVSYILLKSNVGNHLDLGVIREATGIIWVTLKFLAALESVFPNSELSTFISLTRSEKENQLTGLTNLVTGIRLFNKHLEKGGETIEQPILDYAKYTKNSEVSPELQEKIRIGLIFKRQYLIYLDALQHQVIQLATGTMTALGMINKNVEVVHPGNTTQYYKLPVEFGGFCPYSLVECNGLVVPGDKNIGMIRYKDRLFAFATVAYAVEFARSPDM
ncbi:hypothetical protein HDV02_001385 [Globomyces sp. JEL0801]|nr:hypothetical protein HDV02_001385 [Globomyces sp. JEL0801]